jgi:hypothetical protein
MNTRRAVTDINDSTAQRATGIRPFLKLGVNGSRLFGKGE